MVPSSPGPMSNYLIKIPFESQLSALKIVRKLLRAKYGESCTPPTRTLLLFQRNCEGQKRRLNKFHLSPLLWESETSCKFHRPLGQTRNHSPVCKPPILQDVGNLEQETTVTHTLTSLSLTPRSPGWGMERLQNIETILPAQVCTKSHTPDDHRSGEGMIHFIFFNINLFILIGG